MKQLIIKNFWLKMLALFLAFVVWVYVVGELDKGTPDERALLNRVLPYKLAAKSVPVKAAIVGSPRAGYHILNEAIIIRPSTCLVMAPQNLLKNINYVTTEDIDLSEFTRPVSKEARIKPIGGGVMLEKDFFVRVVIPVKKAEAPGKEVKK